MANPFGKLKKKVKEVGSAASEVAARVKQAPGRLVENVKADLADPTSEGYKFAHAPAGQYYLPSAAKKALSFALPTPAETVTSQKKFVEKPGFGTGFRAAMPLVQIATAPALVTGAAALPGAARKGATMIAERGLGRTLASESGARVIGGISKKAVPKTAVDVATAGAKLQAAKSVTGAAARTERVGAKIAGERVASAGLADEAADVAAAARLQKVPTAALKASKTHGAKLELVRRLESTPGAKGGLTRSVTSPETIAKAGIEPAKAPRSRIAGAVSTANRPGQGGLKAASAEVAAPRVSSEVAQQGAASVFQKMPDVALNRMAEQGVSGAQLEAARRSAAALKPKSAFGVGAKPAGPVMNVAKPTAAEAVSVAPKGGGLGMPSQAAKETVVAEVKAAAPKAKVTPKGANPNYNRRPGKVTTKQLSELPAAKPVVAPKRAPGGSTAGAPRGAAIKRTPGADFEAALAAAGEKPSGGIAAKAIKAKVPETGVHPGTGKPVKLTPRGTIERVKDGSGVAESNLAEANAKIAAKAAKAPKAAPVSSAVEGISMGKEAPGGALGVAKRGLASKALSTTTAIPRGILKSRAGKVAVGAGIVAGAFTLGSSRGGGGGGGGGGGAAPEATGGGTTSTAQTIDEAIAGMTDSETKISMVALRAVQKKGEAEGYDALASLREGLGSAQANADFPTQAELQHPHVSERYAQDYKSLVAAGASPEKAQGVVLEKVGKKRDQLLKESVQRAVDMAKQRAKNEAQRKKNR